MKQKTGCAFSAALFLLGCLPLAAADAPTTLHVTCPDTWPGPERPGILLSYSSAYFDTSSAFGPDDSVVSPPYDTSALLDCAYGNVPHIHADSPLRITVAVPGHVHQCRSGRQINDTPVWCDTRPEADGTLGPVRLYLAERVTIATTLMGFSLRSDRKDIATVASSAGFTCTEEAVGNERETFYCVRNGQQVAIHMRQGRSIELEVVGPADELDQARFYDDAVLRFGLRREYEHNGREVTEIWQEPGSPARFTVTWPADHIAVTLRDTSPTE